MGFESMVLLINVRILTVTPERYDIDGVLVSRQFYKNTLFQIL